MRLQRLLHAAAALATIAALEGCAGSTSAARDGKEAAPEGALLAADDVALVVVADLVAGVPVSGTLQPAVDVKLNAPLTEVIETVLIKEGQAVRRGQVLARFHAGALEPAVASAEARHRHAASDYARMLNLVKAGAVSARDVEDAESALKAADAQWAEARKRLDDVTVRSPIDGVVAERFVESGDRVSDGDPMFRVVDTHELEFEATVPAEHVAAVHAGAQVRLTVSGSDAPVTGRIARVNATADEATRQVRVYVAVPNANGKLVGGLFASGRLVTAEATRVPAMPTAALRDSAAGGPGASVLVVEDGKLARRAVTIGVRDDARDLVQVVSGLAEGDTVVTGPIQGLEPGRLVAIGGKER